jgi:katanin p60 ATPase-containing subunit A1
VVDQDAAAAGLPPATTTPRNNENFIAQKKPHTNVKQRPDVFNYDHLDQQPNARPLGNHSPVTNRLADHFGLQPFEHHKLEQMGVDIRVQRGNFVNEPDPPINDRFINHQVFVKQPTKRDDSLQQDKDPDVWDPPTPPKNQKKQKSNPNWGAQRRHNRKPAGGPNQARGAGANPRANPLGAYGNVDRMGGGAPGGRAGNDAGGKRNYDKPWLPPPSEKKNKEAKTYAEYLFGEGGLGPDSELINQIEQNMLVKNPQVSFDDIAELDETKKLLQEAVLLPILMPDYFRGIRRPWKGVCMFGPPGTGKTMLAKAVATQGQTTFFNISAAGMNSKWKGESEKLVRILFDMARFYAPSTIFFDEIDALATQRGKSNENEASRRVKAELLIQMDGVAGSSSASANAAEDEEGAKKTVMVLAATNRPQDLDEAIRRRLEKRVYIPLPTDKGREAIFSINLKGVAIDSGVNFKELVRLTKGYSGADLANVCRDAAMEPMRRKLNSTGFNFENINDHAQEIEAPLKMEDFMTAIGKNQRTVSDDLLKEYSDWMAEFGAS